MLVDFTVSNFMSIKEEVCLSLVARPSEGRDDTHTVTPSLPEHSSPISLVRTAAIYGPNAGGKTNLLLALSAMQNIIRTSSQSRDELQTVPFLFDPDCRERPSTFDVTFILGGIRYQYGFSATTNHVSEEWLFAWPRGRVQVWFHRTGNKYDFGPRLYGPKNAWKTATRSNSLFLSTAVALNSTQLKPIADWFLNSLHIATPGIWSESFTTSLCRSDTADHTITKGDILRFLNSADLSVKNILIEDEEFSSDQLPEDMPAAVRDEIAKGLKGKTVYRVLFSHEVGGGQQSELDLRTESHGTQKIYALAGPWLDVLADGDTIVIDELEDSLHPSLVKYLVNMFHSNKTNPRGAQLIFTTHNTSILTQEVFRRDQIWFCERNRNLETELFPLTQFKPRKGFENLERSYLTGRYGAIPYLHDLEQTGE